jgi:segregation and condensation protein B
MLTKEKQKAIVEGLLFVSLQPVSLQQIQRKLRGILRAEAAQITAAESIESPGKEIALEGSETLVSEIVAEDFDDAAGVLLQLLSKKSELDNDIGREDIKAILREIQEDLMREDRGIELISVAKGYQLRTKYEISAYLHDERPDAPTRLSPSSLETLSVIAYQQPATKQRVEDVRGVDTGGVLKTLLEKEFIRIVGRSEEPGRPLMYGTTVKFLEVFGLNSLKDLPTLNDFQQLSLDDEAKSEPQENEDEQESAYKILPDIVEGEGSDVTDFSEEEQAILDELDSSMKTLKDVEKKMAPTEQPPTT